MKFDVVFGDNTAATIPSYSDIRKPLVLSNRIFLSLDRGGDRMNETSIDLYTIIGELYTNNKQQAMINKHLNERIKQLEGMLTASLADNQKPAYPQPVENFGQEAPANGS